MITEIVRGGATRHDGNAWRFSVWSPFSHSMVLHIVKPMERSIAMDKDASGYFQVICPDLDPETRYYYRPNDQDDFPDPASVFQPEGVHGPSQIVDHTVFNWTDGDWRGKPFRELVIYELHIGTFSDEGTFDGAIPRLGDLVELGVNAIEIMPVSQFPGDWNWGYDGVFPYAVQNSYGGPDGLKQLVDACHSKGIVVILDVVYNHMGPEGNWFAKYGPYFTGQYHTPWGDAINYDQQHSDGVRDYIRGTIDQWVLDYHIDGFRLDAIHTIYDSNPVHSLGELNEHIRYLQETTGRNLFMIAESDLNDPKVVRHPVVGGYGFTAQWLDDFHHALYVLTDPAGKERYEDFGAIHQLAKAYSDGFVHSGEYVRFRRRKYGTSSAGISGDHFVVFIQNHDQVGNRVLGERISALVDTDMLMISAAAVILSPYVPMLFMGEEYGESAPFMYFVDHSDQELIAAVREGRKKEFEVVGSNIESPDPQDATTFMESKLNWPSRREGAHGRLLQWYTTLLNLRRMNPVFRYYSRDQLNVSVTGPASIALYRFTPGKEHEVYVLINLGTEALEYPLPEKGWSRILDSSSFGSAPDSDSSLATAPRSVAVFSRSVKE